MLRLPRKKAPDQMKLKIPMQALPKYYRKLKTQVFYGVVACIHYI